MLLLATLGLIACSLITLGGATRDDIAGLAALLRRPPGGYFVVVGIAADARVSRIDYSRLRELKYGALRACMIALDPARASRSARRPAGRGGAIDLPFFSFQPSELGKVLLVLALSAFVVDRVAPAAATATRRRGSMLLGAVPAALVIAPARPRHGLVYVVIALAVLFVAGTSWQHFAALGGDRAVGDRAGPGRRARRRRPGAAAPTRWSA